ncbi:MAG: hypothetical protein HQ526_05240 [Actinobacteria bacterium]|nr:hypothetical protein [Actinomycetota bacterium]
MAAKSVIRVGTMACGLSVTVVAGALLAPGATAVPSVVAESSKSATAVSASTPTIRKLRKTKRVKIAGGHRTDSRDNGRPVKLIAAALNVPTAVFRDAFARVTPTADGSDPDSSQAQANKEILLQTLAPYGVTNARLDEVSNYYRYFGASGVKWQQTKAKARAKVRRGKIVGFTIQRAGAGYSSNPRIKVAGFPKLKVKAKVAYGTDLATNGRVVRLRVVGGSY